MSLFAIGVGGQAGPVASKALCHLMPAVCFQNGSDSLRGSGTYPGGNPISRRHPAGPLLRTGHGIARTRCGFLAWETQG